MADRGFAKMVKEDPQKQKEYAAAGGRKSSGQFGKNKDPAVEGRKGGKASRSRSS